MAPGKKGHQSKMPGKEEGWKRGRKKVKRLKERGALQDRLVVWATMRNKRILSWSNSGCY